jgi:DNA-directed RNA polymerase alpha subunit
VIKDTSTTKVAIVQLAQPVRKERKPKEGFLSLLSAPARRALEHHGIMTEAELSKYSEKEILKLHGIGPASLPKLRAALEDKGLSFK